MRHPLPQLPTLILVADALFYNSFAVIACLFQVPTGITRDSRWVNTAT